MYSALMALIEQSGDGLLAVEETRLAAEPRGSKSANAPRNVAVIPVSGPLYPRSRETWAGTVPGMDALRSRLKSAAANPEIGSILLMIDSPGGTVAGTPETAAAVRAAAAIKPVVALADSLAASAAYWIGVGATEFVASPSAEVGSIGAVYAHQSYARMMERMGIETTVITSSPYKAEMSPFAPLSEEAKANMQASVDRTGAEFIAWVAAARNVSEKKVAESFGQGRLVDAQQALAAGMIDRIATLDEVIAGMQAGKGRAFRPRRSFAF